jgi:hypothetical protein
MCAETTTTIRLNHIQTMSSWCYLRKKAQYCPQGWPVSGDMDARSVTAQVSPLDIREES